MRLSVIIPAFNARSTIEPCLLSFIPEGFSSARDLEVVVVDDASTDGTADLVAQKFRWVKLIRLAVNVGADAARNAALEVASGDVVAFVDSDCEVLPGWKDVVLSVVRPGAPVAMGRVISPPEFLQRTAALLELGEFLGAERRPIANFATLNVALEASLVRARGGFDGALRTCGDRALSWELHRAGTPIVFEPAMAVRHTPPLALGVFLRRRGRYVDAFVRLRRRDPTLPGARLLRLGPLAAPAVLAVRIPRDLARLLALRGTLGIGWAMLLPYALAIAALRALDAGFLFGRLLRGFGAPPPSTKGTR